MEESWKEVEGYDGRYLISNLGSLMSVSRVVKYSEIQSAKRGGRLLSKIIDRDGYILYGLSKNGLAKLKKAHRLVCIAFIPNPNNYPQVNHKNGIKTDNRVDNLEWVSNRQNIIHAYQNKLIIPTKGSANHASLLTESQVLEIRRRALDGEKRRVLASEYKITIRNLFTILSRGTWKHI